MNSCPIFVLGCRRSGTTWIQRLITSTKEVLVWGETALISKGLEIFDTWTSDHDRGYDNDLHAFRKGGPQVAHLHPFARDLQSAWAEMMESSFGRGARREGYPRWGSKEIFWGQCHVDFIRSHWSDYRIVFLTRNFVDCYRSFVGTGWWTMPENKISYINNEWIRTASIVAGIENNDKERHFRYEDLLKDSRPLMEWCGINVSPQQLAFEGGTQANPSPEDWELARPYEQEITDLHRRLGHESYITS